MPSVTPKQQRRAEKLEARKQEKKLHKQLRQQGLPLPGSSADASSGAPSLVGFPGAARASDGPFFGGMRLVGSRYPVEVPLKLFFDPNPDEGNAGQEEKKESGVEPLPRPPLGDTVVVTAGWSNMSTHGFLSKACILDPRTNQPRRGLEIRGPPVQVDSHMGEFTSPGVVTVKTLSPEMVEKGFAPTPLEFYVYEGTPGVREGMLGNREMEKLGVAEPMRHSTR